MGDEGKLIVDGSIATSSQTTVNAGGTIGGSGTVGNLTINGGTLSPGNSPGTLTVNGNLVLTAAASYFLEVTPTVADRTNVAPFQRAEIVRRTRLLCADAGIQKNRNRACNRKKQP